MYLSLPPSSRRIDPRRRDSNADGRDKLDLRVARQNVNLCRAHGDGYAIVTTVHDHPGCPSMPTRRTRLRCARDPSHPAGLPAHSLLACQGPLVAAGGIAGEILATLTGMP
jgi:hypothetical protein